MKHLQENRSAFIKAFIAARKEIRNPKRDAKAHKNKYAKLDQILDIVVPACLENDLILTQELVNDEQGRPGVKTVLEHIEGGRDENVIYFNSDQPNMHGMGSGFTYMKRYSITAKFGIEAEDMDDDGQKAMPAKKAYPASEGQRKFVADLIKQNSLENKPGIDEWYDNLTSDQAKTFINKYKK